MRYWWVNHKQTFRQEIGGKFGWCPKRKSNGQLSHYYESMREVQPDDFGKVGDAWNTRGWRVDVDFQAFADPLRTANHTQGIAPLLPSKYSPIREDGFGNQVAYFAMIPEAMAKKVDELADPMLALGLSSIFEREELTES